MAAKKNRFGLLKYAVLAFALITLYACGYESLKYPEEVDMGSHGRHAGHGAAAPNAETPSASCAELTESASDAPVQRFELTAAAAVIELNDGSRTEAWTYNGSSPGPEIRVREGDRIQVTLKNDNIRKGVTIHWHGVVLPCSQDGVPGVTQNAVQPGESYTYEFIARHAGTFWYHSHQQSSEQAAKGLIGRLIVEPRIPAFDYDRDEAVILQKLNRHLLVNGRIGSYPIGANPGETVRLRLINAHNRVQYMGVAGAEFRVAALDGHDLNEPGPLREQWVPLGGGQRADLLITVPESGRVSVYSKDEPQWSISLGSGEAPAPLGKEAPIFDFAHYGTPKDDGVTPGMTFDREYDLQLGGAEINGERFHNIPPIVVREGDWVKLRLRHRSGSEHPMHLHGHVFKIVSKNGKPLTGSPVYADSVLLFKGDEYEVVFRADNPGLWMMHCHNLNHAANGMTMMVVYEGVSTSYRVGTKSGNLPD